MNKAVSSTDMGTMWAQEKGLRGKADELGEMPNNLRLREFPNKELAEQGALFGEGVPD